MTCIHLRLNYLEGPGAPALELVAPKGTEAESRFLASIIAQNTIPTAVRVIRTTNKVIASARLFEQDGTPAIPRRAADIMVGVRRCLAQLERERASGIPGLLASQA